MKSSILASSIAIAACGVVAQYTNQSAPFNLIVLSTNHTINGSSLGACHEGAAIEGLCLGPPPSPSGVTYEQFQFNTSATPYDVNETIGAPGYLTYELRGGNFNVSEPLGLTYNDVSNVAVPEFTPGFDSATFVAFDHENRLNIQSYIDDRVVPVEYGEVKAYYRWYICQTYVGYSYTTLAWVMGDHSPENPSCVKVEVVRVFV
jgi:hypothetical protein